MNEIERAISTLEIDAINITGRLATDENTHLVQKLEAINLAQSALREQAERSKGCYHCINSSKKIFAQKERYSNANETGITYETIRVVFCPQCGKRLEDKP